MPEGVSREFAALLYGWTRGNPFFVEETLKALVKCGLSETELMDGPIRAYGALPPAAPPARHTSDKVSTRINARMSMFSLRGVSVATRPNHGSVRYVGILHEGRRKVDMWSA